MTIYPMFPCYIKGDGMENYGTVHCARCEKKIAFFPADVDIDEDIELYCDECIEEIEG